MVENRSRRWRHTLIYAGVIALLSLILILVVNALVRGAAQDGFEQLMRSRVAFAASGPELDTAWSAALEGDNKALSLYLIRTAEAFGGEVVAADSMGRVIASSSPDGGGPADLSATEEVREARAVGFGSDVRRVDGSEESTLFVAAPVTVKGDAKAGVIRWSAVASTVYPNLRRLQIQVAGAIALAALGLLALAVLDRARSSAMTRRLTVLVERAASNDFDGHVLANTPDEIGQLTRAVNRLVDKYRKATKRRAREKDRLNTVLTHMSSGALILEEEGTVRLINPAATELLHTTPEKAIRQSFVQVVRDHRVAEVWQRCKRSGNEEVESIDLGADRFIRVIVTPFIGGDASGYLVILQDLTQMRRLEKVRRDFVSNVSHELRTPLASLNAIVDTLRDGALDDPPATQRFLDRMEIEVDKMTQMVQELLELSRIESGQVPLRLSQCHVRQFVVPAIERMSMQAERAGVRIYAVLDDDFPQVVVDMERLQAVVINLLHNAIKFTPSGGQVTVSAERLADDRGMIGVKVRDTGVGIPLSEQARIFERFYKADRSRSGGGTGLGLAIAKHTIQAHGGEITVESKEGIGSTFTFTLPVNPHSNGAVPATVAVAEPAH
jgi:two-component system phosphate regulon sensor histidine kinase PhoR